jgi:hypothetical protein
LVSFQSTRPFAAWHVLDTLTLSHRRDRAAQRRRPRTLRFGSKPRQQTRNRALYGVDRCARPRQSLDAYQVGRTLPRVTDQNEAHRAPQPTRFHEQSRAGWNH